MALLIGGYASHRGFKAFLAGLVQYVGLIVTLRIMDQADKDGKQLGSEMFCASLLRDARALALHRALPTLLVS